MGVGPRLEPRLQIVLPFRICQHMYYVLMGQAREKLICSGNVGTS